LYGGPNPQHCGCGGSHGFTQALSPGLGIDAAFAEIERNRGIFYDIAIADACLRLFRENGFQLAVA